MSSPRTLSPSKAGRKIRNGNLYDLHLESPHLNGLLHDLVVRYVGDDMLVGADTRGQDLRIGVSLWWEIPS